LFGSRGLPDFRLDRDVPQRIRELVERPFWAALLATFGVDAETGVVLLDRLVRERLAATIPHDASSRVKIRAVLAQLARVSPPSTSLPVANAIDAIGALHDDH